jgi:transporter family-2 protein
LGEGAAVAFVVFLIAIAAGAANPLQSATNAELNKQLGHALWAGLVVYASGFVGVLALQLIFRQPFPGGHIGGVAWWAWLGGLISIGPTLAGLTLTQRLGSGVFTGLSLTAAMISSVLLDQFGWLGLKQHTASPLRLVGCGLLVVGIWLVAKF